MLVLWRSLNGSHSGTSKCKKGVERKKLLLEAEEARAVTSRKFSAYWIPLEMVTSFKYLGIVPSAADYDWTELVQNIVKSRMVWWRISKILSREGEIPRVSGYFFKVVVQLVLLFSEETWVVTPHMGRPLRGFQDQVARRLTGSLPQWRMDRRWNYTSTEAAIVEAGFETMETYV